MRLSCQTKAAINILTVGHYMEGAIGQVHIIVRHCLGGFYVI